MNTKATALALALMTTTCAHAASISADEGLFGDPPQVHIDGQIEDGDADKLQTLFKGLKHRPLIVTLSGPGGKLSEALAMGEIIHQNHLTTMVAGGQSCMSSCAHVWLGGTHRVASRNSRIMWHAPYDDRDPEHGSTIGSAAIGMYLGRMGYSGDTISQVMTVDPYHLHWMITDPAGNVQIKDTVDSAPSD